MYDYFLFSARQIKEFKIADGNDFTISPRINVEIKKDTSKDFRQIVDSLPDYIDFSVQVFDKNNQQIEGCKSRFTFNSTFFVNNSYKEKDRIYNHIFLEFCGVDDFPVSGEEYLFKIKIEDFIAVEKKIIVGVKEDIINKNKFKCSIDILQHQKIIEKIKKMKEAGEKIDYRVLNQYSTSTILSLQKNQQERSEEVLYKFSSRVVAYKEKFFYNQNNFLIKSIKQIMVPNSEKNYTSIFSFDNDSCWAQNKEKSHSNFEEDQVVYYNQHLQEKKENQKIKTEVITYDENKFFNLTRSRYKDYVKIFSNTFPLEEYQVPFVDSAIEFYQISNNNYFK